MFSLSIAPPSCLLLDGVLASAVGSKMGARYSTILQALRSVSLPELRGNLGSWTRHGEDVNFGALVLCTNSW